MILLRISLICILLSLWVTVQGLSPARKSSVIAAWSSTSLAPSRHRATSSLFSSYLDNLSSAHQPAYYDPPAPDAPAGPIVKDLTPPPPSIPTFVHASKAYFSVDQMTPKGPRANADVGQPHDATRPLFKETTLTVGSWWCAKGGWPSPKLRDTTEVFLVFEGNGCLTDTDGTQHYFGPGDTVILPKGWSGRWDVLQDIHKVWFVHDHCYVVETTDPIRARVISTSSLSAPHYMQPTQSGLLSLASSVHGEQHHTRSNVVYNLGPTAVGGSSYEPRNYWLSNTMRQECFHVLEGVFYLANAHDGSAQRCMAGDTVVIPQGWSGYWDVLEPVRTLWVTTQ